MFLPLSFSLFLLSTLALAWVVASVRHELEVEAPEYAADFYLKGWGQAIFPGIAPVRLSVLFGRPAPTQNTHGVITAIRVLAIARIVALILCLIGVLFELHAIS